VPCEERASALRGARKCLAKSAQVPCEERASALRGARRVLYSYLTSDSQGARRELDCNLSQVLYTVYSTEVSQQY
jgi:hypothetical protein